jgi:signal-transduction protein with cAMP-binding, CBS, and nucleotidyltransferase domain
MDGCIYFKKGGLMSEQIVKVEDVMRREAPTVDGMTSAKEAVEAMRSSGVTQVLVSKRSEHDALGIVTMMDLVENVLIPDRDPENVMVYEIMTKPVISVPAKMDIRYAIRLIRSVGVQCAPVEEGGEIVGMIAIPELILKKKVF